MICPGEDDCEMFLSARGKTREEKEQGACIGPKCPAFPSKVSKERVEKTERRLNWILNRALNLRQQRDSGLAFCPENEPAAVAETILMLDEETKIFERGLKLETNRFLKEIRERPGL
jgi:hypothetical protein